MRKSYATPASPARRVSTRQATFALAQVACVASANLLIGKIKRTNALRNASFLREKAPRARVHEISPINKPARATQATWACAKIACHVETRRARDAGVACDFRAHSRVSLATPSARSTIPGRNERLPVFQPPIPGLCARSIPVGLRGKIRNNKPFGLAYMVNNQAESGFQLIVVKPKPK